MSSTTGILPKAAEAHTHPDAPAALYRGESCWRWVVLACPFCGDEHWHGGGPHDGNPMSFLGGRLSHCVGAEKSHYILTDSGRRYLPTKAPKRGRGVRR